MFNEELYSVIIEYKDDLNKPDYTAYCGEDYDESCRIFDELELTPDIKKILRLNNFETMEVKE